MYKDSHEDMAMKAKKGSKDYKEDLSQNHKVSTWMKDAKEDHQGKAKKGSKDYKEDHSSSVKVHKMMV